MDKSRIAWLRARPGAMRDLFEVYDAHYEEIGAESVQAMMAIPSLAPLIEQLRASADPDTAATRQQETRSLMRKAMLEGDWERYLAHTREAGAGYARSGLDYAIWTAAVTAARPAITARLRSSFGSDPDRFLAAVDALGVFLDAALAVIGEEYLKVREEGIRAAVADAAAHQQAEDRIRALNAELEREIAERSAANSELEAFTYTVSHDLRAPLRAINGFVEALVEDHGGELSEGAREYLDDIAANGRQLAQLIEDLLAFSRISRALPHRSRVNPAMVARRVVDSLRRDGSNQAVKVAVERMPSCQADPALLAQVYQNLLSNAFKFTRGRPGPEVTVGHLAGERPTTYFVRDNGVGFEPAYADKLFGVFQRLHPTEDFEGNGVGLAIVQRIVQRHGGRAWAEGYPGEGATFYFTLTGEGDAR